MRALCHNRLFLTRRPYATLISVSVWSITALISPSAWAAEPSLGLVTGLKEAQIAVDGKQWTTLQTSSSPIYERSMIRTGKGTASVLLKDGAQLELQSHTLVGLSGSRANPVVKIAVGHVLFRVPIASRTTFVTPSVRYQIENVNIGDLPAVLKAQASTLAATDSVGAIVVNVRGGSRLGLQQGEILAKSLNDPGLHIVKAGQSVYIPQAGSGDPGFGVMLAQALPDDADISADSTSTDAADTEGQGVPVVGIDNGTKTETVVGLGVGLAAVGLGVGLGVDFSGKASPSTP